MTLNPARLARFADWAQTLPPRPLPRTAIPVPGEYYLDYAGRLADANHLELPELTGAVEDPAAVTLPPDSWKQHQQERLAAAAGQPLARVARLYWDDPGHHLRDPDRFRQMLRPACRRCTARRGITGPIACHLLPHQTVCRRHRLWTGPAACAHAGQLDISPFPEILRAQRRHLAQLRQYQHQDVEAAVSAATRAIYQALRAGIWIPGQRQRLRQLAPAPGIRPWPARSAPAPAGQTTATPSLRSRYTPTSSGSPHAASGHTAPATAERPEIPGQRAGGPG